MNNASAGKSNSGMLAGAVALVLALCACNFPSIIAAGSATPSPTVTLTPGTAVAVITGPPTDTGEATVADSPTPTATVFSLPPTPGRTPTEPFSTMLPHGTLTPTPGGQPGGPHIDSFSASPADVDPGGSVTLSWKASGDKITLFAVTAAGQLNQGTDVQPEGSTTVTIDSSLRNSATYMLYATTGSQSVNASVKITVHCPDSWFFGNPPALCPSGPAAVSNGAYEHFEHGLMIWVAGTDRIVVLYDNQAAPAWFVYDNTWDSSMPETDPSITPPTGRYQPVRGFGLLWRTEAAGKPDSPRARLGWAVEPESSFNTAFQCDSAFKYSNCYVKGPLGETILLKTQGSGWLNWSGPS